MNFLTCFFLLYLILIILPLFPLNSAQLTTFLYHECDDATYSPKSTYQKNLNQVLHSLSTDTQITYGFYNFTAGHKPDKVEAIALCRGDVPLGTCRVCVRDSATTLPTLCSNRKQAFAFGEHCVIFYSYNNIFRQNVQDPGYSLWNNENATDLPGLTQISDLKPLNKTIYTLMNSLRNKAAGGNSTLKYGTDEVRVPGSRNRSVYGLVQCNPDLSRVDCLKCVDGLVSIFSEYVSLSNFTAAGERGYCVSCNIRFEFYKFYDNVADVASPPSISPPPSNTSGSGTPTKGSNKSHKVRIVAISVAGSFALIIVALICFLLWRRKHKKSSTKFTKDEIQTLRSLQYSFGSIKAATGDFSNDNKLGKGGFGTVYKGKLPDGQEIAVKRLLRNTDKGSEQFKNEVLLLAKLQHRNLVKLLGFCLEEEEIILIYEFGVNGSLDNLVFDPVHRASMKWERRFNIIRGVARGLFYLHEDSRLMIIHRDLKAGNVLLDADFNPKIADFGMARLFNIDQTQAITRNIAGTYGYMPPEYLLHGHVSTKLDVYSFGVLVLEIISGQRISSFKIDQDPENLLTFAWQNWVEGTPQNLVDPTLSSEFSTEIQRCMHIGLLCVQQNMGDRPNMSAVTQMLNEFSLSLKPPSQPASFVRGQTPADEEHKPGSGTSGEGSLNLVTISQAYPR